MVLTPKGVGLSGGWSLAVKSASSVADSRRLALFLGALAGPRLTVGSLKISRGPCFLRGPNGPRRTNYSIRFCSIAIKAELLAIGLQQQPLRLPTTTYVMGNRWSRQSLVVVRPLIHFPLCKKTELYYEELALIDYLSLKATSTVKKKTYSEITFSYFRKFRLKFNLFTLSHSRLKNILFAMYSLVLFSYLFVLFIAFVIRDHIIIRPLFSLPATVFEGNTAGSPFYFLQLFLFWMLMSPIVLSYLHGHRYFGYPLNPEVEQAWYPPLVIAMLSLLAIVILVVNFTHSALDGPYSFRPLFLKVTKLAVAVLYFYYSCGLITIAVSVLWKLCGLNIFVLTSTGSLFFFVVYYLGGLLTFAGTELLVKSAVVTKLR